MLDREAVIAWYRRNRERTRMLFDLVAARSDDGDVASRDEGAYYNRPIALRHPVVFYEGHLPAFSFNTLVKKGLGEESIDPRLEALFARGIDPHEAGPNGSPEKGAPAGWPTRDEVHAFAAEADRRVLDALSRADLERPGHPLLDRAEAVFAILEHEAMHHETLLYMWHRLPLEDKHRPDNYAPRVEGTVPRQEWIEIPGSPSSPSGPGGPGGFVTLGVNRDDLIFGWDNEFPRHVANVDTFSIERFNVTNAQFLDFVDAGGYTERGWWREEDWNWIQSERIAHPLFWERATGRTEVLRYNNHGNDDGHGGGWWWRGMFERIPLPLAWPVYVSHAEAAAYARWRGARLMTEAEYQRAAFGVPKAAAAPGVPFGSPDGERLYPWGSDRPSAAHGVFDRLRASGASASHAEALAEAGARDQVVRGEADFSSYDPEPVGSHPAGRSAWGVDDLVGNGWEWTSTAFAPFPGFRAMASYPEYSADFFDGEHMVLKGASPVTAADLLRPTFRNWFRPRYPYVYATFRCVRDRQD